MRSVALDLGAKSISYCEVKDGQVVDRATVRKLSDLQDRLGPKATAARVAFEACREAWHVHDWLARAGHTPLMVDTTRVKQIGIGQHRRKNDRIDAEALARSVDQNTLPAAHVLSPHRRELRDQLSIHRALVDSRAHLVALARETARGRAHQLPSCATANFAAKLREAPLEESTRTLLDPLLKVVDVLDREIDSADQALVDRCKEEPVIAQLMTAPGVGPIVAAAFVSVIDEAKRFSNAHQVEAYLGLVPSEKSSGNPKKQRLGSITKQGNSYARAMLVQASWTILLRSDENDPLRRWGEAVAQRRGKRVAVIAIARRLAGVLWAMWRRGTVYDPSALGAATAAGMKGAARTIEAAAQDIAIAARKYKRLGTPEQPERLIKPRRRKPSTAMMTTTAA